MTATFPKPPPVAVEVDPIAVADLATHAAQVTGVHGVPALVSPDDDGKGLIWSGGTWAASPTPLVFRSELDDEAAARAAHEALTTSAHGGIVADTDPRLSDSRAPVGVAGGDLVGAYPNPSISATYVSPGAVALAPAVSARNVVQPTADVDILTLKRSAAGANNSLMRLQQADGTDLFKFDDNRLRIYKGGGVAPEINFVADNTPGAVVGWGVGIDVGAPIPNRDFFIGKLLPAGGMRDFLYANHNGTAEPTLNIGRSPGDSLYRVTVATDQGTPGMGGLSVYQSTANTGLALAVRDWSDIVRFSAHTNGAVALNGAAAKLSITGLTTTTTAAVATRASGDAGDRFNVAAGGLLSWLPGDGTAADVTLGRGAANRLDLKLGELRAFRSSGGVALATAVTNDANRRWQVQAQGDLLWGDGALSPDVKASRSAAGALLVQGTGGAVGTTFKVQAVAGQAQNLQEWADSTGGALTYVGPSGAWKQWRTTVGNGGTPTNAMFQVVGGVATDVQAIVRGWTGQAADLLQLQDQAQTVLARFNAAGQLGLSNSLAPATPTSGGVLYAIGGALHFKGSAGTDTVLAAA